MSGMKGFIKYLRVQTKRSLRLYPVILCFTLILSACILLLFGAVAQEDSSDEKNIRIKIGLIGDIEDTHLGMGISAVSEFDSSRFYVEFIPLDGESAEKALEAGELTGYVSVPDGFVDSVIHGTNMHLTYVEGNDPSALGPMLTREIVDIVSAIVTESQGGVFGLSDIAEEEGMEYSDIRAAMEELDLRYFDIIFSRDGMYDLEVVGTGEGLGFADYYFSALLLVLVLLWGVICVPLMCTRSTSLSRLLYSRGRSALCQSIAEYIPFFGMIFFNTLLLTASAGTVLPDIEGSLFAGLFLGWDKLIFTAVRLLPCIALITAMQFFLYELSSNIITSVLVQLLCTLGLSYISGFIYPIGSLPSAIRSFASVTPTGMAFEYLSDLFIRDPKPLQLLPLAVSFVIFMAASILLRRMKLRRVTV